MDYIEIDGYKSIKKSRIELRAINVLIGANGSGKSNFVSFFEFLNRLYNRKLNDYISLKGGADKILHKGRKNTDIIYFKLGFEGGKNGYSAMLKSGNDGFVFLEENLIYDGKGWEIGRSSREANIKLSSVVGAKYVMSYLNGFRKYHFHDTSENSSFTKFSNIDNDSYYFYEDGSNLAAFLYHIQETNKIVYNRIVKTIQSIAPYFSDFYFTPNKENNIRMQWTDKFSNVVFGASDLSDGTLRFIALTVLFLQPELPDTIIIDEPELGLHPASISKLSGMIESAAGRGCQVILATQSTDLVSCFQPEDIISVDQKHGETFFNRLNSASLSKWLNDYTIGDLWKRNIIIGGQPNY